jgi:hypothetical protein
MIDGQCALLAASTRSNLLSVYLQVNAGIEDIFNIGFVLSQQLREI